MPEGPEIRQAADRIEKALTKEPIVEVIAGIGNDLRSEILFVSGVHPDKRPADGPEEELERVAQAILTLVRRSYETGGITVDMWSWRRGG